MGGDVSLQTVIEASKAYATTSQLSLPHVCGSTVSSQLLLQNHAYLPAAMLSAVTVRDSSLLKS